jgi:threonine/homoserine/homoserine lactone efflux protein
MGLGLLGMGCLAGFLSSTPLGPINLFVTNAVASGRQRTVRWLVAGVISADVTYAGIAFFGFSKTGYGTDPLTKVIGVAGGLFLMVLGVLGIRTLRRGMTSQAPVVERRSAPAALALGAFLCGSNPGFLLFWLAVLRFLGGAAPFAATVFTAACFLAGVAIGDSLWFTLMTRLVDRQAKILKPRLVLGFRHAAAWAFVGLGMLALVKSAVLNPLDDAQLAASERHQGLAVESTELKVDDGRLVFAVNLVPARPGGLIHEVELDAITGRFVADNLQTPDEDEAGRSRAILVFKGLRRWGGH